MSNIIDLREYLHKKRDLANKLNFTWEKHHYYFERFQVTKSRFHEFMANYYVEKALAMEDKFAAMRFSK